MRPVAAPLMAREFNLDARTFALGDGTAKRLDQGLNVCEDDRSKRGLGEDRGERLAVSGVHRDMISESAISGDLVALRCYV